MLIRRVRVYPNNSNPLVLAAGADYHFVSQLQSGTETEIDEVHHVGLIAQGSFQLTFLTGVGVQVTKIWPLEMQAIAAIPVVVSPTLTILHDAEINHAAFQSKIIRTVIDYDLVEIGDKIFRTLYMNQTRQT
jgi:hypothetical protein